ncbi:TetR/AcrR family transcriptional regulator [Eilatimonas milleporae]|uniref:TetR family transcriptional regulator n=1 Tax=Eilatimonas milleporae TaxID=911205 RepID=A0A3M0CIK8_9PROT|nr:TetR/AcrR family transcriptional regulator C-terminal domain-containing protein [Eilatimonas milleporae]RMB08685.1 TetR family transcriptional regulator [Eilatimonas milleporae]
MNNKLKERGRLGLSRAAIVQTAITLIEAEGETGFTMRKLAAKVGCDPMTVLYHVKSKAELERAMAEALNETIQLPDPKAPWRDRIVSLAQQCHTLAQRHPETFKLLLRFRGTGPADLRNTEVIYQALSDAGVPDSMIVDVGFGLYASVLGLAMAEIGGLLRPADATALEAIDALPVADYPALHRLLPSYAAESGGRTFETTLHMLLDGIEKYIRDRDLPR